ncbi:MAG TPA: hypothetical protein PLA68_04135 [Panacibacter sp.]|nr:hypothetical protein [Panacibacter sp.]
MGMYDNVKVSSKFLPDNIKHHTDEWQTKSYDRLLNLLTIEEDGKLYIDNTVDNWERSGENKFLEHTGEIRFYHSINDEWWEFVAFFEKGNLLKIIQTAPEK